MKKKIFTFSILIMPALAVWYFVALLISFFRYLTSMAGDWTYYLITFPFVDGNNLMMVIACIISGILALKAFFGNEQRGKLLIKSGIWGISGIALHSLIFWFFSWQFTFPIVIFIPVYILLLGILCIRKGESRILCRITKQQKLYGAFTDDQDADNAQCRSAEESLISHALSEASTITFGHYLQEDDETVSDLEWIVAQVEDGKALLLSKYALECLPYNKKACAVTWESCSLSRWLNEDFLLKAFSRQEMERIYPVRYSNERNKIIENMVFLLTETEIEQYFPENSSRVCMPTKYAMLQGASVSDGDFPGCGWWLNVGMTSSREAKYIDASGEPAACAADAFDIAVRPALWIEVPDNSTDE